MGLFLEYPTSSAGLEDDAHDSGSALIPFIRPD